MFEIYAYGNVDTLTGVFNAIAAIMGGDDYFGLIKTVAVTGVLVAAFAGLFTPGRFHGWGWLMGFMFLYYALFLPKADVVIVDKLGSQTPVVVGNVPIGVAFFGHYTSKVGDVMTRFFETAFQVIPATNAQLPSELAYQKNGVMFGNRLIQASRRANIADPQLRTDLIAYVYNCTLYDLQDGTIDPAAFSQSTDIWALMGTPNPARFSTYGNPVQVDTCPNVYTYLANRLPAEVARARAMLAFQLNPSLDPTAAQGVIDSQIEQAYYKTRIATAAQGASDLLRQNIMINLVQDTSSIVGQKINDPASVMIATARANATASINSSFLTMGKVAEQALPLIRNVIEAIIYAVFPFVFLLFLLAQGKGLGLALKSFVLSLVWIQLWPPLYAILNYVATLASAKNLEAAARMGAATQGLALDTASSIYHGAISDQAVAGYMVISIPIIATAIIKGGEVAFQAVTGVGAIQSTASGESSATSKGNVSQDMVSFDQQQRGPTRSSAFMSTTSDAHGTTIQGAGPDAGVFRYQATLSRLATTFTFTERQATALTENAREAETLARSERESMQRSQASALTRALGIQESFDRSQQRSGASTTSDGGSTSTQIQKLNSVAREVNRRLGLGEDSIVGKSVAASASVGARIPFTEIGAQAKTEGPTGRPATAPKRLRLRTQGRRDRTTVGSDCTRQGVPLLRCLPMGAGAARQVRRPASTRHIAKRWIINPQARMPTVEPKNSRGPRNSCASGAAAPRPTSPTTQHAGYRSAACFARTIRSSCSAPSPRSPSATPKAVRSAVSSSPATAPWRRVAPCPNCLAGHRRRCARISTNPTGRATPTRCGTRQPRMTVRSGSASRTSAPHRGKPLATTLRHG
ncbi:MAG: conjugal transfer protein TraG N-terminal domain-containing protein [Betaproteobacteria bacterium]|nr:conjugal transfer protein TraG N-terminal domain-containing protein [Betaproteobacteria bacterium]